METIKTRTADVAFSRKEFSWKKVSSYLPTMIRKIAKIEYNHVGVIVFNWGVPMVNEAVGRGVISTPLKDWLIGKSVIIKRFEGDIQEPVFAIEANHFLGHTPYDFKGLFWHQLVWNLRGKWIGPKGTKNAIQKFYCYEYAAYLWRSIYPTWVSVVPADFFNLPSKTIYIKD